MLRPARRRRLNACAECFRLRAKCTYREGAAHDKVAEKCDRCAKLGRTCTPRVLLRGKASRRNRIGGPIETEAFRGLAILANKESAAAYYNAASVFVKVYRSKGLTEPPLSLRWWTNALFLNAMATKSMGRLHAVTCLALSTGCPIDKDLLSNRAPQRLDDLDVNSLTTHVCTEELYSAEPTAVYIVRRVCGSREIVFNPLLIHLFGQVSDVVPPLGESSSIAIELWQSFLHDRLAQMEPLQKFLSQIIVDGVSELPIRTHGATTAYMQFRTASAESFTFRDKSGAPLSARAEFSGTLSKEGRLMFWAFKLMDIKALNSLATSRLTKCLALAEQEKSKPCRFSLLIDNDSDFDESFSESSSACESPASSLRQHPRHEQESLHAHVPPRPARPSEAPLQGHNRISLNAQFEHPAAYHSDLPGHAQAVHQFVGDTRAGPPPYPVTEAQSEAAFAHPGEGYYEFEVRRFAQPEYGLHLHSTQAAYTDEPGSNTPGPGLRKGELAEGHVAPRAQLVMSDLEIPVPADFPGIDRPEDVWEAFTGVVDVIGGPSVMSSWSF